MEFDETLTRRNDVHTMFTIENIIHYKNQLTMIVPALFVIVFLANHGVLPRVLETT